MSTNAKSGCAADPVIEFRDVGINRVDAKSCAR